VIVLNHGEKSGRTGHQDQNYRDTGNS
jgi:hypothetical protein